MSLADTLATFPLFSTLSPEQRRTLANACVEAPCAKGKLFFSEGQEASGLYFLTQGMVKVFRAGPDGREAVLHIFGPGEPFGEAAVFQGGKFPASAVCTADGRSVFLPRRALLEQIQHDPNLALAMLAALSRRLRGFAAKVEALTLMETPQRLAAFLLLTSEEQNSTDELTLDMSKSLLAGLLGTARETLSRCISRFSDQGIIAVEGRTVRLLDLNALKGLAEGSENL